MVSIKDAWKRLSVLSLPALVLAFSVVWTMAAFAQTSGPTQKLFSAVHVNDMTAIKSAIAAGADLAAKNADGKTAADVAVDKGHFIIAHHLLSVRSSKLSSRRALALAPLNPKDRLRKKTPKPARTKAAVTKSATKALPRPKIKPVPPLRPDTATRVSEMLEPVVAKKSKSKPARRIKAFNYRIPPRKPSRIPELMAEAVVVGKSPGVQKPDGGHIKPPKAVDLLTETVVEVPEKPILEEKSGLPNPVAAVGDFFSSLVDLVSPDDDQSLDTPKAKVAGAVATKPEKKATKIAKQSASERTLGRIQNLLGDAPKENAFGLPIVEDTVVKKAAPKNATDTVLDRLVKASDKKVGDKKAAYLDDKPGPETGPSRDLTEQDRKIIPVSSTLQLRLKRLSDAVSRDVQVDTDAILKRGWRRTSESMLASTEQRPKVPRATILSPTSPISHANPEINPVVERALRPEDRLKHRQTPADRFVDRVARIKLLEEAQENAYGIPSGKQRIPMDTQIAEKRPSPDTEEPSVLDRMVGFFGAKDTQPEVSKSITAVPAAPEYRSSPSARALPKEMPAPEIENLKAFDMEDETKPTQQPGSIEPIFLDRLAGLFNEEEAAQSEGWKAEVKADNPFPDRGELMQDAAEKQTNDPWTTTVEMNVGEGKDPVIIQVAKSSDDTDVAPAPQRSGGKQSVMAKKAYGDPLREPQVSKAETEKKNFFGRLTKLFQPKDPMSLERESLLLEQDEKLSTAHDASGGGVEVASRTGTDAKTYWPITTLMKSDPAPQTVRSQKALTRTTLTDVTLSMGQSVHLENMYPPGKDGTDPDNFCVKKNRGTTLFCIDPIDWADEIKSSFMIATILYTGPMAIVRYDQAQASRLHALFISNDFDKIAAHYQNRFGEPTEILKRSIAPLAKPRQDNPTISWRSLDRKTNAITVLEIRKYDDTRGGFPDTSRGAVMLYFTTSPSIFPQVSSHELMRLKRIVDITQTEAEKVASEADAAKDAPALKEAKDTPAPKGPEVSPDELLGSTPAVSPGLEEFEKPEDILKEPVLSEPRLTEPSLVQPQANVAPEPITDEQPDEIIEILPN